MITPRLESGENIFDVLREKFNALAEAVDRLDKLSSATPFLDVIDTGAGKLIRWNGPEPENAHASVENVIRSGYAGPFSVEYDGGTTVRIYNAADPSSEYAGQIVVGSSRRNMPVGTVTVTTGVAADIYLTVYYSTVNRDLVCAFATTLSQDVSGVRGWYRKLARVSAAGTVTQLHLNGDIEICGRWWR